MIAIVRQWPWTACVAFCVASFSTRMLLAAGSLHAVFSQAQGGSGVVSTGKSYTMHAAVILLLFGLALYVVCKSSRRA